LLLLVVFLCSLWQKRLRSTEFFEFVGFIEFIGFNLKQFKKPEKHRLSVFYFFQISNSQFRT